MTARWYLTYEQEENLAVAVRVSDDRDALHRLFPRRPTAALHRLRTDLTDRSGLGIDAYQCAYRAIGATARRLADLEAAHRSGHVEFGRRPASAEQVDRARTAAHRAEEYFDALKTSRPVTLRALTALEKVTGPAPPAVDGIAARAAQLTAASRRCAPAAGHTHQRVVRHRPGPRLP